MGNSLKIFRDSYLDDILYYEDSYPRELLVKVLMLIPDAMKYKEGYLAHAKVFFSDIDKVSDLPDEFMYKLQFKGNEWVYDDTRDGDKILKKVKLLIKQKFDKEK